ncbi:MAG: molybdenum cofactor biosynthesis protein B [Methyloceanibacter sp.]|nr:MAG: molybdenum cofactor biosynthesis protein B [Methyloceanibacter sp.]
MTARIDHTRPFIPVRIAVLTVSDTRTPKTDKSGPLLAQMIEEAGHTLAGRAVAPDDEKSIRKAVKKWVKAKDIDVVITTGGTGFTGRDVTPEAVRPIFDKEIDGFSVLFHMLSYQTVGTSTIQSRACGGLAKGTLDLLRPRLSRVRARTHGAAFSSSSSTTATGLAPSSS